MDIELTSDLAFHKGGELFDILSRSIPGIDNHQRLLRIDLCSTDSCAFETGLVNKPCRIQFHTLHTRFRIRGEGVTWNLNSGELLEFLMIAFTDLRILEETPCTSDHSRIRKLGISNRDYFFCHFPDRWHSSKAFGETLQWAVFQMLRHSAGDKTERNFQNKITALPFILKFTVTISERTILRSNADHGACEGIKTCYACNNIGRFNTICSDVLDRSRSHISGDTGKILSTGKILLKTEINKIGPFHTGTGNYIAHRLRLVVSHDIPNSGAQYKTIIIMKEEKIATSANVKNISGRKFLLPGKPKELLFGRIFGIPTGAYRNSEGGERG